MTAISSRLRVHDECIAIACRTTLFGAAGVGVRLNQQCCSDMGIHSNQRQLDFYYLLAANIAKRRCILLRTGC